jgi:hypothetical protein
MEDADRKTAHLNSPGSEEYVKLWMQVFHDTLWGDTSALDGPDRMDYPAFPTRNSSGVAWSLDHKREGDRVSAYHDDWKGGSDAGLIYGLAVAYMVVLSIVIVTYLSVYS